MYAYATKETPATPVDFGQPSELEELHTWRKHPNLHGWMHQLYKAKGGTHPDFNLEPVTLTADDLDRLERAVRKRRLPHTDGCFFGTSDGSEQSGDLEFIGKARAAIGEGKTVIYLAWW